ncbi:MAG: VOC family protein [Aquincola sp.]|nr:VOC family protein [Aquincola sp.]MDH4289594.1 VOC family protein [Aquincola sp.]MDH5329921.1 VOC family protein [Aquincola sp.]
MNVRVDHLVVAAQTLDEGAQWCEATLGITPGPGGKHALMGTHNRLFRIAGDRFPDAYFEIIAIDPAAPPLGRARWFGLDTVDVSAGPRLVHWVGRIPAIEADLQALRSLGIDAGEVLAASRDTPHGPLHWRIAVRRDGALQFGGALPTLIEWGERHPATTMPASGVTLRSLTLRRLGAAIVDTLGLQDVLVAADSGPALCAQLDTPLGPVTLDTAH